MTNDNRPLRRRSVFGGRAGRGALRQIRLERRASPRPGEIPRALVPAVPPEEFRQRLDRNQALVEAALPHLEWAANLLADLRAVVYLVDPEGVVLQSVGPSPEILEESGASPGVDWSERAAGPNAAGDALAADKAVFALGSTQGELSWRRYTALAVPVHGAGGGLVGAVVAATSDESGDDDHLALASYAALAAERRLGKEDSATQESAAGRHEARRRHDEAGRFRRLLDAAPDATVLVDERGAILYANAQVKPLLGYDPEELLGKPVEILVPESLRGTDVLHRDQFFRDARVREMGLDLVLYARRRDGREVPVEISLSPVRMREGQLVSASLRDVTARKGALLRLEIEYSVSRTLSEAGDVAEAASRILEAVVRGTGWDAGELWLVDPGGKGLRAVEFWRSPSLECAEFERQTRALVLGRGQSMAGRVWEAATPVRISDLSKEGNFSRTQAAVQAGLRTAFGFPITLGTRVLGVLEFFSRAEFALDDQTLRMLASLGSQVGQFIERRRVEESLRTTETKLELLLRQMPLALWTVDERLTITYCSGKLYETGSIGPAPSYFGKSISSAFAPGHESVTVYERALRGSPGRYDLEADGRCFNCHVEPLRDSGGSIVGAVCAAIDLTELKKSQDLLRESEARLGLMTDRVPAVLWTTNQELRLTSAAGAVLENLGLRASGLVGRGVGELFRELGIGDSPEESHGRALTGESVEFESRLGARTYAGKVEPLRDRAGATVGVVGVAFDVTTLKRAEREARRLGTDLERTVRERTAELEESLREMNAFSYTIAHDLRAPLRAIVSGAGIVLEERDRMGSEARGWTERILEAARRMDSLVTGLLDYSRLLKEDLPLERVEWERVVNAALGQMRVEITQTSAEIRVQRPLPRVRAHGLTLSQALGNLLSNAIKFVAPGVPPKVVIRAERVMPSEARGDHEIGRARIWVEDNGIGIAPEHQERIFGVFERLHTREAFPGTGIGLAIVRRVVERMGGEVGVLSEPGKGSRFFIDLPEA